MTLDELERRYSPQPDGYGLDLSADPDGLRRIASEVHYLITRLRATEALVMRATEALVMRAFAEGRDCAFEDAISGNGRTWKNSDAKAALDALREGRC